MLGLNVELDAEVLPVEDGGRSSSDEKRTEWELCLRSYGVLEAVLIAESAERDESFGRGSESNEMRG